MTVNLPTVLTKDGLQPQTPAALLAQLLASVAATNPGITFNLPGSLIEDISSTDVGAIAEIDRARVETVNSLTPYGCNAFVLNQLGQVYGVALGQQSNTSVFVTFLARSSSGDPQPGLVIGKGFVVSDGSFQYVVQDGGITGTDGFTPQLFCLANQAGTWTVPPGTVVHIVTSPPVNISLTVTNPEAGVPGTDTETETSYRSRVLQAGLAASTGMLRYLRTLLGNVPGVQQRLISAIPQTGGGWEVIVGGGDLYQVANAIYTALFDISTLVGSTMSIIDITAALPAVVTTLLNHGYTVGQPVVIAGVTPSGYDGSYVVEEVLTEKTFALGKPFLGQNLTGASWSGGDATFTVASAHGVTVGSTFAITGCTPIGYDGIYVAIAGTTGTTLVGALTPDPGTIVTEGQLLAGVSNFDATGLGSYTSGGVLTPNFRNVSATIIDYPDTYVIPFVNPPQQIVTMTVTWNTDSPNFVSGAAIAQAAVPALVDYVNSVSVGHPMNELEMTRAFQTATVDILPTEFLSRLVFAIAIDGVGTSPTSGTGLVVGDPESYFFSVESGISVVQG
jgi:hypothetical protein